MQSYNLFLPSQNFYTFFFFFYIIFEIFLSFCLFYAFYRRFFVSFFFSRLIWILQILVVFLQ